MSVQEVRSSASICAFYVNLATLGSPAVLTQRVLYQNKSAHRVSGRICWTMWLKAAGLATRSRVCQRLILIEQFKASFRHPSCICTAVRRFFTYKSKMLISVKHFPCTLGVNFQRLFSLHGLQLSSGISSTPLPSTQELSRNRRMNVAYTHTLWWETRKITIWKGRSNLSRPLTCHTDLSAAHFFAHACY